MQVSEYVAIDQLVKNSPENAPIADTVLLAAARRWYWGRKRDRGFLLASFPATLEHALVFDEWMDAREETLSACLWIHQDYAAAAAEAARCHVCPQDGFVGYADSGETGVALDCDSCGARMEPCARKALAALDRWHQTVGCSESEIARHYAEMGLLQRVDASTFELPEVAVH